MAEMEAMTRKWGNSLGITLSRNVIEEEDLHENQKVIVEIKKVADMKRFFGAFKFSKSAQQIKDEMREGWK